MRYRTPAALEMAVKAAAKASPLDTNLAISGFNFYRLLCRVFSEKDRKFVLKRARALSKQRKGPRGVAVARKTIMASLDLADQVDEA